MNKKIAKYLRSIIACAALFIPIAASASVSGIAYSDKGVTPATSKSVSLAVGGAVVETVTTNATTGAFTFTTTPSSSTPFIIYLDDNDAASRGTTTSIGTGATLSTVDIYHAWNIMRDDGSTKLTIANINTAKGALTDLDISPVVTGGNLSFSSSTANNILIPASNTFEPLGDVSFNTIDIVGILSTPNTETLTVTGDWVTSTGGIFQRGSSLIQFVGTVDQGITHTSSGYANDVIINKTSGNIVFNSTVGAYGDWTFTSADGLTHNNNEFRMYGTGLGLRTFLPGPYAYNSFYNLQGSSGTLQLEGDFILDDWLHLWTGTLDVNSASNYTISVGGDWRVNTGNFSARNGTVELIGTNQTIENSETFYNLSKSVSSADVLTVSSGETVTVTGALTLSGTDGELLSFVSSASGSQFNLAANGTTDTSYLDVKDSNASTSTVSPVPANNSTNSGNNINWSFPVVSTTIDGTAYSVKDTTLALSKNISMAVAGVVVETVVSDAVTGEFSFTTIPGAGTPFIIYFDENLTTLRGVISDISTGAPVSGLALNHGWNAFRSDGASTISNGNVATAKGALVDADISPSVLAGAITFDANANNVLVPVGHTYTPGGNVTVNEVDIDGTLIASTETYDVSGDWSLSGTFISGTSTLSFTGSTASTFTPSSSAYYNVSNNKAQTLTFSGTAIIDNDFRYEPLSGFRGISGGAISLKGDLYANAFTSTGSTTTITLDGTTDQTITVSSVDGELPTLIANKASGNVILGSDIRLNKSWIWTAAAGLTHNNFALIFKGNNSPIFTPGNADYYDVQVLTGTLFTTNGEGTVKNDFTFDPISFQSWDGSALNVEGDVTFGINTNGYSGGGNVKLVGAANQTITSAATSGTPKISINKPSGNVVLGSDLILSKDWHWISGDGITHNNFVMEFVRDTTNTFTTGGVTYGDIKITKSTQGIRLIGELITSGSITLSSGTLDTYTGNENITLAGDWINAGGTFTENTATVTFNGTAQSITGGETFYNLSKVVAAADSLTIGASSTVTVTGLATLKGASGQLLSLVSSTPTTQYTTVFSGTTDLDYLNVTDAIGTGSATTPVAPTNSTDGGNTVDWSFPVPPSIDGIAYTDKGTVVATSVNVSMAIAGSVVETVTTHATTGAFGFTTIPAAGTPFIIYHDDDLDSRRGVTVSKGTGNAITGMDIYHRYNHMRSDGGVLSNNDISTAKGALSDADITPTITAGALTFAASVGYIIIPVGHSFTPGGDVTTTGADINGTLTAGAETYSVTGTWRNTGTFTVGTSTVLFNGIGNQGITGQFYKVEVNKSGGKLEFDSNITVAQDWVFSGSTLQHNNFDLIFVGTDKTTISPSSVSYHNVSILKDHNSTQLGGNMTIANNLNISPLQNMNIKGNDYFVGGDVTFGSAMNGFSSQSEVVLNGGGVQAITSSAIGNGIPIMNINKPTGEVVLNSNLIIVNSFSWSSTGVTFTHNGNALQFEYNLLSNFLPGEVAYAGIINNKSGTLNLLGPLDITDVTLNSGTLDVSASNHAISVSGNWVNAGGAFTERAGTVTLDGSGQSITGTETFHNLTKTVATADTLTFSSGATTTVSGLATLKGAAGQLLSLVSSSPGTQYTTVFSGTADLDYLSVTDAIGTGSATVPVAPLNSVSGGNTVDWFSLIAGIAYTDKGVTVATSVNVSMAIGGVVVETVSSNATTGAFSFTTIPGANVPFILYHDDNLTTRRGTASSKGTGSAIVGMDIYHGWNIIRSDGGVLSNTDIGTAKGGLSDPDISPSVAVDALSFESNSNRLLVESGHSFTPAGDISARDIDIDGTFNAGNNTYTTIVDFNAADGVFNPSTSTILLTAIDSYINVASNNTYNVTSNSARIRITDTLTVLNDFRNESTGGGSGSLHTLGAILDLKGDYYCNELCSHGGTTVKFTGTTDQSINSSSDYAFFSVIEINKPSGNIVFNTGVETNNKWNWVTADGLVHNNKALRFVGGASVLPTFIGGGQSYYDVINNRGNTFRVFGDAVVENDLYIEPSGTAGGFSFHVGPASMSVKGDVYFNDNARSDARETTIITLSGAGDQSIINTGTAGSQGILPSIVVNKASGAVILNDNINLNGDWRWNAGPTFIHNGFSFKFQDADFWPYDLLSGGKEIGGLENNSDTLTTSILDNLIVAGDVVITSGSLDVTAANYSITLGGDWINAGGTFNERSGSVIMNGTAQSITGGEAFFNLTKTVTVADTLTVSAGNTITVSNTATLKGAVGQLLTLQSDTPGSQFNVAFNGTTDLDYLSVSDSNASTSTVAKPLNPTNSVDGGNTVDWFAAFLSGILYSDKGITPATSKNVSLAIGGAVVETVLTDGSGQYSFTQMPGSGVPFIVYVDQNSSSLRGATLSKGTGGSLIGLSTYHAWNIIRSDGGALSNADIATAKGILTDQDIAFSVSAGAFVIASDHSLLIESGHAFTPSGDVQVNANDLELDGTLNAGNNTIIVHGSFDASTGTFNAGTSTLEFIGSPGRTFTVGANTYYNVNFNNGGGGTTLVGDLNISNDITALSAFVGGGGVINLSGDAFVTTILSSDVYFVGAGDQSINAVTAATPTVANVFVNKPSGNLIFNTDINLYNYNWTSSDGLVHNNNTVTFTLNGSQTITPGPYAFYNFTVTKTFNFSIANGLKIDNDLTYQPSVGGSGTFYGDVEVKGDVFINERSGSGANSGTLTLNGTLDQTIASADADGGLRRIVINKPSGSVILGSTISLNGGWEYLSGDGLVHNNHAIEFESFTTDNFITGGFEYGSIVVNKSPGNRVITLQDTLTLAGNIEVASGGFAAGDNTVNVAGDWVNSGGIFNENTSTVVFNGTNQSIQGSETFAGLTKTITTTDTLTFDAGATVTVTGLATLKGAADQLLALQSDTPGSQFSMSFTGTIDLNYLSVKDSDASGSTVGKPINPANSVNLLNTIDWFTLIADLSASTLIVTISDPINGTTNPKAIPGAILEYTVTVSNTAGFDRADNVVIAVDLTLSNTQIAFEDDGYGLGEGITITAPNLYGGVTTQLTGATDADEGEFDPATDIVSVTGISVDGGESAIAKFRVQVQ